MSRPDSAPTQPALPATIAPDGEAASKGTSSRPPTSRDVARLAGVSQTTVSHVMTGKTGVSAASRELVLAAASSLGYRPNLAARSMRTRLTGRLAVVMPMTSYNPAPLLIGATQAAAEAGFTVEVHGLAGGPAERAERVQSLLDSRQFEGLLTLASVSVEQDPTGPPVVSLGEFDDEMHVTGELTDATPVETIVQEIASRGSRRFLHVAGDLSFPSARARRDAFLEVTERLRLRSLGVSGGAWTGRAGYEAIFELDDDVLPLAVVAANDLVAAGVVRAASERGWDIPGDLVVSGWDDLPQSEFFTPPLTTVRVNFESLGAHAMHRLIASVRTAVAAPPLVPLQRVIWRQSTG